MTDSVRRESRRPGVTATIGVFDGVHRGHQAILRKTLQRSASRGTRSAVVTFDRHPLSVLAPHLAPRCLQTLPQRLAEFRALGFHRVMVLPFRPRLASLEPDDFIGRVLLRRFPLAELVVGYDFHFGRGGKGSARLLLELGRAFGFNVTVVPAILEQGEPISSTRIRRLVSLGKMPETRRLLAHPYRLAGRRVRGEGRGRELGFPTINVIPENELLPPRGVYAVRLRHGGGAGVANLGVGPTFPRTGRAVQLEIHLINGIPSSFRRRNLEVSLEKFLRSERRFAGPAALKRQIALDVVAARRWLKK